MNIVITGANGFVGKHLTNELFDSGHTVIGIGMEPEAPEAIKDKLSEYASCNLAESWPELQTPVDAVIHLAGLAAVGPSFKRPQDYISLNSAMVTNLCEYYVGRDKKPRVVLVSSGAVYDPNQAMPIAEAGDIAFSSPYAVSKVLTEHQAAYYNQRGMECVVMRPFNHIGPGQLPGFLVPDLAEKIRSRPSDKPISVGNLETSRDYTDVRDVARAYAILATAEKKPTELVYNVCSGVSKSGVEVLAALAQAFGVSVPTTGVDQSLIRPNEIMDIKGDNSLIVKEFNWSQNYSFQQTINDFVESI
jgi:GDP-4-dehydro-6-deoxy-D-mannose reductase